MTKYFYYCGIIEIFPGTSTGDFAKTASAIIKGSVNGAPDYISFNNCLVEWHGLGK